jgi:hypothetical protein
LVNKCRPRPGSFKNLRHFRDRGGIKLKQAGNDLFDFLARLTGSTSSSHQFDVNPDMFVGNLLPSSGWMLKTEQEPPVIKENLVLSAMA